jgi:hypothetical protein
MSLLTRILGRMADPSRLLRRRRTDARGTPPCTPAPPRDPPRVRPPSGGCSTGPTPQFGRRTDTGGA